MHDFPCVNVEYLCYWVSRQYLSLSWKSSPQNYSNSESPQFIGRVVAALANDPNIVRKSDKVLVAAQEALECGIQDIDEKQPRPLTIKDFQSWRLPPTNCDSRFIINGYNHYER
jgi:hypothetical protein